MSHPLAETPIRCLPRSFRSKDGTPVELHRLPRAAGQRLIDMYLAFQPRNSFQGLPPIKDAVCVKWVREMLETGLHITAIAKRPDDPAQASDVRPAEDAIVGHAALFPVNEQKCEMLVVVCPSFQNLGVGTELVRGCIDLADELGFQRIWLPVDATNVRARHVYRKCGFEYLSNRQGRELDMACEARRWASAVAKPALAAAPTASPLPVVPLDGPLAAGLSAQVTA